MSGIVGNEINFTGYNIAFFFSIFRSCSFYYFLLIPRAISNGLARKACLYDKELMKTSFYIKLLQLFTIMSIDPKSYSIHTSSESQQSTSQANILEIGKAQSKYKIYCSLH